jgi:hypothetical protein
MWTLATLTFGKPKVTSFTVFWMMPTKENEDTREGKACCRLHSTYVAIFVRVSHSYLEERALCGRRDRVDYFVGTMELILGPW